MLTTPYSSRYNPVWEILKKDNTVAIAAMPQLHKRVIKAVLKRKNLDIAFKFSQAELGYRCKIEYQITGNTIIFSLKRKLRLSAL